MYLFDLCCMFYNNAAYYLLIHDNSLQNQSAAGTKIYCSPAKPHVKGTYMYMYVAPLQLYALRQYTSADGPSVASAVLESESL